MNQLLFSNSVEETFNIGVSLSEKVSAGDIFLISGSLGAGKSVLIRGIAHGLGIEEDLPSPTFTLVNEYNGKYKVFHFDFYRLNDPYELYEIGFEEYIYSDAVSFIEWPSKCGDMTPDDAIQIDISLVDEVREINIKWKK